MPPKADGGSQTQTSGRTKQVRKPIFRSLFTRLGGGGKGRSKDADAAGPVGENRAATKAAEPAIASGSGSGTVRGFGSKKVKKSGETKVDGPQNGLEAAKAVQGPPRSVSFENDRGGERGTRVDGLPSSGMQSSLFPSNRSGTVDSSSLGLDHSGANTTEDLSVEDDRRRSRRRNSDGDDDGGDGGGDGDGDREEDQADEDASTRPISPSSVAASSILSGSASINSHTNQTFKSFITGASHASTKPTTLLSVDSGGGGNRIAVVPPNHGQLPIGIIHPPITRSDGSGGTANTTESFGTTAPANQEDGNSVSISVHGPGSAPTGTNGQSSSPLAGLTQSPTTSIQSPFTGSERGVGGAPSRSSSYHHHPTISSGSSIHFSTLPIASSTSPSTPSGLPQIANYPRHTQPHPRNNPYPTSAPTDNASTLTLASSTAAISHHHRHAYGAPDEDASVRALPPSRRDSASSFGSRWSAAVLSTATTGILVQDSTGAGGNGKHRPPSLLTTGTTGTNGPVPSSSSPLATRYDPAGQDSEAEAEISAEAEPRGEETETEKESLARADGIVERTREEEFVTPAQTPADISSASSFFGQREDRTNEISSTPASKLKDLVIAADAVKKEESESRARKASEAASERAKAGGSDGAEAVDGVEAGVKTPTKPGFKDL